MMTTTVHEKRLELIATAQLPIEQLTDKVIKETWNRWIHVFDEEEKSPEKCVEELAGWLKKECPNDEVRLEWLESLCDMDKSKQNNLMGMAGDLAEELAYEQAQKIWATNKSVAAARVMAKDGQGDGGISWWVHG